MPKVVNNNRFGPGRSKPSSSRAKTLRQCWMVFLVILFAAWAVFFVFGRPRSHVTVSSLFQGISWLWNGNSDSERLANLARAAAGPYVAPVKAAPFVFDPNATIPDRLYVTDIEEDHGYPVAVAHDKRDIGRRFEEKDGDVCWAIQLTNDRLPMLESSLRRWRGPVSAVLYSANVTEDLLMVRQSPVLEEYREQVRFYFVPSSPGPYPVNLLRNIAVRKCPTEYVLQVDVDFQCQADLHGTLVRLLPDWHAQVQQLEQQASSAKEQLVAFVLPAFEMKKKEAEIPETRDQVIAGIPHIIDQVHNVTGLSIAHSYTKYDVWMKSEPTEIYPLVYKLPFEPYYVVRKALLPPHDVRLAGYGNDKVGQPYEMSLAGFKFYGAACCYLVHQWHPPGAWKHNSKSAWDNRWEDFRFDVARRYEPKKPRNESLPANLFPVVGSVGETCVSACQKDGGKICSAAHVSYLNYCDTMRTYFECKTCYSGNMGTDLPAVDIRQKMCNLNNPKADIVFKCDGKHPHTSRLCPCVPSK